MRHITRVTVAKADDNIDWEGWLFEILNGRLPAFEAWLDDQKGRKTL